MEHIYKISSEEFAKGEILPSREMKDLKNLLKDAKISMYCFFDIVRNCYRVRFARYHRVLNVYFYEQGSRIFEHDAKELTCYYDLVMLLKNSFYILEEDHNWFRSIGIRRSNG